jgi:hypothetical protein
MYRLQNASAVIHFTAQGKLWSHEPGQIRIFKRDAHPLFAEQFEMRRNIAKDVCPGGIPG